MDFDGKQPMSDRHRTFRTGTQLASRTKNILFRIGAVLLVVLFVPLLLFLSSSIMLVLFWPIFLGARLEYGFSPGARSIDSTSLWPEWYLLLFVWWGLMLIGPYLVIRYHDQLEISRRWPAALRFPRPRV